MTKEWHGSALRLNCCVASRQASTQCLSFLFAGRAMGVPTEPSLGLVSLRRHLYRFRPDGDA